MSFLYKTIFLECELGHILHPGKISGILILGTSRQDPWNHNKERMRLVRSEDFPSHLYVVEELEVAGLAGSLAHSLGQLQRASSSLSPVATWHGVWGAALFCELTHEVNLCLSVCPNGLPGKTLAKSEQEVLRNKTKTTKSFGFAPLMAAGLFLTIHYGQDGELQRRTHLTWRRWEPPPLAHQTGELFGSASWDCYGNHLQRGSSSTREEEKGTGGTYLLLYTHSTF